MDRTKLCKDRRRLLRLVYDKPMRITIDEKISFVCKIRDLSLKGAFVVMGEENRLEKDDIFSFEILLHEGESSFNICGKGQVVRKADNGYGVSFLEMEVEDFGRLRRLLSLNVADAERVVKDFEKIID